MNRIIHFLSAPCSTCRKLNEIERALNAASIEAERIEALTDCVEFWLPNAERVLKPKADDGDDVGIRLIVSIEPRVAAIDERLSDYAIEELRYMAHKLTQAADAIEGGVSP